MNKIKAFFARRTPGFWSAFGAAVLAFVGALTYVIVYNTSLAGDRGFSAVVFVCMLVGALTAVGAEIADCKFGPLVPSVLFAVAVGLHFQLAAYPFADALTGVPFFGGSPAAALVFGIVFAVAALANIVAAFTDHRTAAAA